MFGQPAAPKDFEAIELILIKVAQPPSDTVSDMSFSPQADYLAASSWDNQVWQYPDKDKNLWSAG